MPKLVTIYILFSGILLAGTYLGVEFVTEMQFGRKPQSPARAAPAETVPQFADDMTMSTDVLNELDWQNLDEALMLVGKDSEKRDHVLHISSAIHSPAALYLRGVVLMINHQPLQALTVFNQLNIRDIPANFLYPVYRLNRQIQPESASADRFLHVLKGAISSGRVSPLTAARVEAQEGQLYSALSNYLKTDPAQWVTYDIECIKRIGQHSGLYSEVLRMVSGAVKSRRLSEKVEKPLRRYLTSDRDSDEVNAFKRSLARELLKDSSSGKIAVSSIKQMLDNRSAFMQRDYQKLLAKHKNTAPLMVPNESVLMLFLASVHLKNRLEMDRWGQEIKRRYPNREVIDWVSELITSVK